MSITGTATGSTAPTGISVDDVRMFLRDYAPNNILLDDVHFTDLELDKALTYAVDEFNVTLPISTDSLTSIPPSLLILGASAWLMRSESFLQLRNQATYQDGDIAPIGVDDKHGLYLQLSAQIKAEWKETVQRYKQAQNMESSYGSIGSGYRNVGRFHNN